jgi:hypothetical protein
MRRAIRINVTTTTARRAAIWSISKIDVPETGKNCSCGKYARMYTGHQNTMERLRSVNVKTPVKKRGQMMCSVQNIAVGINPALAVNHNVPLRPLLFARLYTNATAVTARVMPTPHRYPYDR